MNDPLLKLSQRLGYTFKNEQLVTLALTHRSKGGTNNERLEFLGDSILNFVVAEDLYQRFDQAREGKLSRLRARMVKGKTLADLAREFDLGDFLILGSGELKSGGHRRESILADTVEALIGAIYLDAGLDAARRCILSWYQTRLDELSLEDPIKDPKTRLQEYQQSKHLPLPKYNVLALTGPTNEQIFKVEVQIQDAEPQVAEGASRRAAEQAAAMQVLTELGIREEEK
ncbi:MULTISPECIES: ribonuclease III [unclassified Oceanobacter]|uniref:ribonuclease III n=2 Tax=Gammaproteobacteria TaxID=1236 RepID=UPI0026E2868A|nr:MULTISPECIES: ribonuclease III [unclassified Oceanobacter]MDO6682584.1 ribonuclease III [Oceanobacter sp. 5_MG-2023]MDP2506800.1 ribonuclease III [Oceanobacter sp. 3_MG-2023]MDP2547891.1 ribonuclease III [Oceanobacter sp. 4_MG-2023]MDP2608817.1 ribonuclease III [Oceanobacter sp. 1_MG-2023]MDP2611941.1 ribonuclease III [Oceanobacter sp. 2_MG-2023]